MKPARRIMMWLTLAAVLFVPGRSHAETAIGAVFGYPGNAGVSLRFDRTAMGLAWSSDFFHGTADMWMKKTALEAKQTSWYWGVGVDAGIPLDDNEEFFLAGRVPVGIQYMASPRLELFAEIAPGLQLLDETDFYWAGGAGIRFVLGH